MLGGWLAGPVLIKGLRLSRIKDDAAGNMKLA